MQRQAPLSLAIVLTFGAAAALAQSGDLSSVTMRVLDDVSDVDAVVLALDANGGEGEAAAEPAGADAAATDERREPAAGNAGDERRERADLHHVDDDERGEGRLEDRDVERPAAPAPAP